MTLLIAISSLLLFQDANPIRNFLRIDPNFCTGGQPNMQQLEKLKAEGITTIINLRTADEYNVAQEEAKAKELGLKYFNIPVVYTAPKEEQATEFLKIMSDTKNRPVFIHCTAAIRVGAFWLIRRVVRDGMSWDAALDESRKVGLVNAPHLEEFAKAYIDKRRR